MTYSDKELQRQIAYAMHALDVAIRKYGEKSWSVEKIQENLNCLRNQLAKPREERMQWEPGPGIL